VCSTDDCYADDVHYMGGCLLGDNLSWASIMLDRNSCPPDPEIAGERWKDMWRARLEGSGLWLNTWLRHQHRDDYWKHGSICEDFDAVQCPVMAVSGWADGYSNAVFRLLKGLSVPRRGLIGPWSHKYPHLGVPGPAIGFLQESLRWWDRWLKDEDTGVDDEPMLRVWMQDSVPPTTSYELRPGRWVAEESWPSSRVENQRFPLDVARIGGRNEDVEHVPITVQSPLRLGLFAGKWCSYAAPPDLPSDQREEDGGALVFDSGPLTDTVEILGAPVVELELSSDKPVAMIAARLSDIAPDHRTTRVTYGLLNLTHRDSHEYPEPLEPDRRYRVRVRMNGVAYSFPPAHRIRVALSTSYWPLAWAPPELTRLTVFTGTSELHLPVRPPSAGDEALREFPEPEVAPFGEKTLIEPSEKGWEVIRDLAVDKSTLRVIKDDGTVRIEDIDLELTKRSTEKYTVWNDDPHSVRGEDRWESIFRRGDWKARTVTRTVLTSTASDFHLHADIDAYDGERRFFCRSWREVIPRELV
jgi:predicted acyl esterase